MFIFVLVVGFLCMSIRLFFFFNDPATTEIYTLSLHDALPIYYVSWRNERAPGTEVVAGVEVRRFPVDRKSGSAGMPSPISYAVFCLRKNKQQNTKLPATSAERILMSVPTVRVDAP